MSDPQIEVTIQSPGQAERRAVLAAGVTQLGRGEDNELVLPDAGVSRKHARIRVEGSSVIIEDLGSGNGVWFRGNRVERMDLKDGDQIYIDPFTLSFRIPGRARSSMVVGATPSAAPVAPPPAPAPPPAAPEAAPASAGVRPRGQLTTLSGPKLLPAYVLRDPLTTLGRSNQRDIILFDPASSRLQAEITIQNGAFWIKDGGSANGTFLNGEPARNQPLKDGDRIRVGGTEFRFDQLPAQGSASAAGSPAEPPRGNSAKDNATVARPRPPLTPAPPDPVLDRRTQALPLPPKARPGTQRALLGGVLVVVFLGLFISVLLFALALHQAGGVEVLQRALHTRAEPLPLPPPPPAGVRDGLKSGRDLYDQGKYVEALAQYRDVRKLDADNMLAQHMVYASCEALSLAAMRADLVPQAAPPAPARKSSR